MAKQQHIRTEYNDGSVVLSNVSNNHTRKTYELKKVSEWVDGSPMDDAKADGRVYRKLGAEYFKVISDKDIDLESIGVKYNDTSAASTNLTICAIAINLGYNIVIKDKLYISGTAQEIVANSISIRGEGENAEIVGSGSLFSLPDVLTTYSITNIKITSQGGLLAVAAFKTGEFQYQSVIHKNLTIEGNFSFRLYGTNAVNSHVNHFEFSNCVVRNNNYSMLIISDVTYDKALINNNALYEMGSRIISDGIDNNFSNKDLIKLGKKLLIISNNTLINSNETFMTEASSSYLVLALTEAYESHYFNNYVEGLKSVVDISIYDIYQSSEISYYYNNVWKNNMCFVLGASSQGTKILYKGKGSRETQVYNNTWIIEKSFLEKFIADHPEYSLNLADCYVGYQSFDTTDDSNVNFYFKNNIIDVYYLRNLSTTNQRVNKYEIEGNSITCEILEHYFMVARYGYKTGTRSYTFKNNIINVLGGNGSSWGIMAASTPSSQMEGEFVDLDFSGNIINTNSGLTAIVSLVSNLTVSNNKIICNNRVFLMNASKIQGVFTGENNTITTNNSGSAIFFPKLQVIGKMSFKCSLFTNNAIKVSTDSLALVDRGVNYVLSQRVILSCPDFGETDVTVYMRRKIVGGDHYVEYTDDGGVLREKKIETGMTFSSSINNLYQFKDRYTNSDIASLRVDVRDNEPVLELRITGGNNNYTIKLEYNVQ